MAESIATRRRGRPKSGARQKLEHWAAQVNGRFTLHNVVDSLGLSLPCANVTLARSVDAGMLRRVGMVQVPWSKRPVVEYEPVMASTQAQRDNDLTSALNAWARSARASAD